jgi:hypothetical protein
MSEVASNIQESNQQILNDIQSLQKTEQGLFNSLETNPNLTNEQQQEILQKINQITNMRLNLYQTLSGVNGFFQNALKTSHGTLTDQSSAISIVENDLNQLKQNLKSIEQEKNNKIRLVEINSYYGDKYAEHSKLMKIIIYTLLPIIVLAIINRSGILPPIIYYILLYIIVAVGGYYFVMTLISVLSRDPMDYDEYDWFFDPNNAPKQNGSSSEDPWLNSMLDTCIGADCCSTGQTYDKYLFQCVGSSTVNVKPKTSKQNSNTSSSSGSSSSSSSGSTSGSSSGSTSGSSSGSTSGSSSSSSSGSSSNVESYVNHVLTKTSTTNNYKYDNAFSSPKPSSSSSFLTYPTFR